MEASARVARLRRGSVAAVLSTGVALACHVHAGGAIPGPLGVLLPMLLTLLVGTLTGGAKPNLAGLLATTIAAQLLFHALFTFSTPGAASTQGHAHHVDAIPDLAGGAPADDARMWQMHLIAAVFTALLMHRGELLLAWLRQRARAVGERLVSLPVAPALPARRAAVAVAPTTAPVTWTMRSLLRRAPRRGPPVLLGT